jgi:hypothetical protein
MIADDEMTDAIRRLMRLDGTFSILCLGVLLIGQVAGQGVDRYWVCLRADDGEVRWEQQGLTIDEAIAHFLRLRAECGLKRSTPDGPTPPDDYHV